MVVLAQQHEDVALAGAGLSCVPTAFLLSLQHFGAVANAASRAS